MKSDLISIIVPVYNVESFLERCINSIVNQDYENTEIILINDGSTDNSSIICKKWEGKDSRIKVINQDNSGLSHARNRGIDAASGKYLMFVDSDDFIDTTICNNLITLLVKNNAEIAICDALHVFDYEKNRFQIKSDVTVLSSNEAINELWYQKSFLPSAWGKIYKREIFKKIRFTEGIIYEDIDIMHELLWSVNKIVYTKSKLYGYVHRENSITSKQFDIRDIDILIVAEKVLLFSINKSDCLKKAARAYAVTAAFRVYLNSPDTKEFQDAILISKNIIKRYSKSVLFDNDVRQKTKFAIIIYNILPFLLKPVYGKINRWKP